MRDLGFNGAGRPRAYSRERRGVVDVGDVVGILVVCDRADRQRANGIRSCKNALAHGASREARVVAGGLQYEHAICVLDVVQGDAEIAEGPICNLTCDAERQVPDLHRLVLELYSAANVFDQLVLFYGDLARIGHHGRIE